MRRTDCIPFESLNSITFLCEKNNSSLFAFGNHNKKRPNNIIFGRLFDYKLLNMYEFGINNKTFKSIESFLKVKHNNSIDSGNKTFNYGSKPGLLFQGNLFIHDETFKNIKNFFIDYFSGQVISKLNLLGFDHLMVFTSLNKDNKNIILFRVYKIEYQPSKNNKIPYCQLIEIGPSCDFELRRHEEGNDDIWKLANQHPNSVTNLNPKQKNIKLSKSFKQREARIFIDKSQQNLNKFQFKKVKALKKKKSKLIIPKDGMMSNKKGNLLNKKMNRKARNKKAKSAKYRMHTGTIM